MAPHNEKRLTDEWNRRIGNRTGNKARPQSRRMKQGQTQAGIRSGEKSTSARIAAGTSKLPAATRKEYERTFGPRSVGGGSSASSSFQKTMQNVVDDTVKELQQKIDMESAIAQAMENPVQQPDQDRSFLQGAFDLVTKKGPLGDIFGGGDENWGNQGEQAANGMSTWQGLMEDFSRSPVGRGLDIISRPAYGVATGLNEALKAGYGTDNEGGKDDLLHSFDDLLGGFGQGLTGEKKTGFGDVWHTMRQNSDMAGMEQLRNLDESHPGYTRWLDRGVGLAGEITMDPTNYLGGAAVPVIRGTGQTLTEQTGKAAVREAVETAARDFYDDIVTTMGKTRWRPSQDAFAIQAMNAAEAQMERNILEISGGGHSGWSKMGGKTLPASTSHAVTQAVSDEFFRPLERNVEAITQALNQGGNLPIRSWRSRLAQSPELEKVIDALDAEFTSKNRVYSTTDDLVMGLTKQDIPAIQRAVNAVREGMDGEFAHVYSRVFEDVENLYYNTVGLRVNLPGGRRVGTNAQKIIPVKTIGKAYHTVKGALAPTKAGDLADNAAKAISYERAFPGRLSLMTQHNRSIGVKIAEEFRDKWRNIAKNFTTEQARILQESIENGTVLTGDMERIRQQIMREYRGMFYEEVNRGARSPADKMADNYAFVHTKGGRKEARSEFKEGRKKWVNDNRNTGRFTTADAKSRGLAPTENAFEALMARKLKSIRDNTRAMFMKDLLDNYGIMTKPVGDLRVERTGMKEIPYAQLPNAMKQLHDKGQRFYLPKEHFNLFETYKNLSGWNPADNGMIVRNLNKMTSFIKFMSTVPRPGFHVRNMIGDYMMGMLDDVPTRAYGEVARKWELNRLGKAVSFRISQNYSESWEKMWEMYEKHANSGFFDVEVPMGGDVPTAGQHLNNTRKKASDIMRRGSDNREDYGRFVHFVSAYRQEVNKLLKKGGHNLDRIKDKALEAAVWRVNAYKFDYGALTGFEKKMKLAFPFYTFQRKAAPALLESMFLNPKYLSLPNRFMEYNDGSAQDNFNNYYLPPYAKDLGYAFLNNEDEPLFMTNDIMPSNVLNSLDTTNSQEFAQSIAQQLNPIGQILPEMALGQQFFSGQATGSFPEYIANKFSVPGQFINQVSNNPNTPNWLEALNESWLGAGIPVRQFTEQQQDFGFREAEDRFVQDPFSDFNKQETGFRVYASTRNDGTSFRVENVNTGEVVYESLNPTEALAAAKNLAGIRN